MELYAWEQDEDTIEVAKDPDTGVVTLQATDRDGDVVLIELSRQIARALGVALVNGTTS